MFAWQTLWHKDFVGHQQLALGLLQSQKKSQRALAKSSSFPMVPPLLRIWGSSINSGFSTFSSSPWPTVWICSLNTDKIQVMSRCQETTTTGMTHEYLAEAVWLWPVTCLWNRGAIPSLGITIPYVEQLHLSAAFTPASPEPGKATFYKLNLKLLCYYSQTSGTILMWSVLWITYTFTCNPCTSPGYHNYQKQ